MNRRQFLSTLLASVAATAVLDPERLLWAPTKTIVIPPAPKLAFHKDAFSMVTEGLNVGDIFTVAGRYAINPVTRKLT